MIGCKTPNKQTISESKQQWRLQKRFVAYEQIYFSRTFSPLIILGVYKAGLINIRLHMLCSLVLSILAAVALYVIKDALRLNPFPNNPCSTGLVKTKWEKEKLLVTSNFSFSHSVFYPFGEPSAIFIKFEIVVCRLFSFGNV